MGALALTSAVIAVSTLLVLGGRTLSRESRQTLQRAFALARTFRIAGQCLDEFARSAAGQEALLGAILDPLAGGATDRVDPSLLEDAILPADPAALLFLTGIADRDGGRAMTFHPGDDRDEEPVVYRGAALPGLTWVRPPPHLPANCVRFATERYRFTHPVTLIRQAYGQEIDQGLVTIEGGGVTVEPLFYAYRGSGPLLPVSTSTGEGVFQVRVTVTCDGVTRTLGRRVRFSIVRDGDTAGWRLVVRDGAVPPEVTS